MDSAQVIALCEKMLVLVIYLAAPIVISGMIVGLIVSVVQAITQVQEQSISFVCKVMASGLALLFFGPWMLQKSMDFAILYLGDLTRFLR